VQAICVSSDLVLSVATVPRFAFLSFVTQSMSAAAAPASTLDKIEDLILSTLGAIVQCEKLQRKSKQPQYMRWEYTATHCTASSQVVEERRSVLCFPPGHRKARESWKFGNPLKHHLVVATQEFVNSQVPFARLCRGCTPPYSKTGTSPNGLLICLPHTSSALTFRCPMRGAVIFTTPTRKCSGANRKATP
jgi:hypothetical protein